MLWNTICYYEQEVGRSSLNNLKKKINTYSPETTLRNSNLTYFPLLLLAYTYRLFCYLEVITYVIFYFQIQVIFTQRLNRLFFLLRSHNIYHFLFSDSSYIQITFNFPFFFSRPHKQKSSLRFSDIVVVSYYRRLFLSASVKTLICHIKMNLSNSNMPSLADK